MKPLRTQRPPRKLLSKRRARGARSGSIYTIIIFSCYLGIFM